MKDFCIFEDYESQFSNKFPDYNKNTLILQKFLLTDNDNK